MNCNGCKDIINHRMLLFIVSGGNRTENGVYSNRHFMKWCQGKWNEFKKETDNTSTYMTDQDQCDFDNWLLEKVRGSKVDLPLFKVEDYK